MEYNNQKLLFIDENNILPREIMFDIKTKNTFDILVYTISIEALKDIYNFLSSEVSINKLLYFLYASNSEYQTVEKQFHNFTKID